MTKTSVRITSFILAVIMLLSAILFTEFGTIKVEAAAADGSTSLSGGSYPTSGYSAQQDYAIRVFPIPAGLVDNYSGSDVDKLKRVMRRISTSGWSATLAGKNTLGKYRTDSMSVWVFPRQDTPGDEPVMYTGYTEGSFKGFQYSDLDNVITYTDIKNKPDAFEALFKDIAFIENSDSHIQDVNDNSGYTQDLADKLNSAIAAYRKAQSKNDNSLFTAMKKHIKSERAKSTLDTLMASESVTLAFEIYIGAGVGAKTDAMFSVSALQDYAAALEGSEGAFSSNCQFSYYPEGSYRFALYYSFGIAFNALKPGYFTSDDWYSNKTVPKGNPIFDSDGETPLGGGGWCFYTFKTAPLTVYDPPTPTKANLTVYINKQVTKIGEGATPSIEVTIGYCDPYKKKATLSAEKTAFLNAVESSSTSVSTAIQSAYFHRINATTPNFSKCHTITTSNKRAKITFSLAVDRSSTAKTTVYFIPIYETQVVNGVRYLGDWGTMPAGLIRAVYSYDSDTKKWGWTTEYSAFTSVNSLPVGASQQVSNATIRFTNSYTIKDRSAIRLVYGAFAINRYRQAYLTYDDKAWAGSALAGKIRKVYEIATSAGGGTTFRLASGTSAYCTRDSSSDKRDLSAFAEAAWGSSQSTLTADMPEKGTTYTRDTTNIRFNMLKDSTTSFTVAKDSLALLNPMAVYGKSAATTNMLTYTYDTSVSRRMVTNTDYSSSYITLKEGKTYSFPVSSDREVVASKAALQNKLNQFGNYCAKYALYEGASLRNYHEFEYYLNYYIKQFTWLKIQVSNATSDTTRNKYLDAMKALTGYTYSWDGSEVKVKTKPASSTLVPDIYIRLMDMDTCSGYIAFVENKTSSEAIINSIRRPAETSQLGKWATDAAKYAEAIVNLDKKRPASSITVMTSYTKTDTGSHFKPAIAPQYYLSMRWNDGEFITNSSYLRSVVYDFNTTPGLYTSGATYQFSAPAMYYNITAAAPPSMYFRSAYGKYLSKASSLTFKSNSDIVALCNRLSPTFTLDSGSSYVTVSGSTGKIGKIIADGKSPTAFDNYISTNYPFTVSSNIWKVTSSSGLCLPSADYAKAAFGGDAILPAANALSSSTRGNKGTVSATKDYTATSILRIWHENTFSDTSVGTSSTVYEKDPVKTGYFCYMQINAKRDSITLNSSTGEGTWSAQSVLEKLTVQFKTYKSPSRTINNITAGTAETANGSSGWFTRDVTYKVYPLVKAAYYNGSTLAYTYIVGSTVRTIPANTYYTVTVTNNNSIPTATATAIASDSRAKALQTKLRVNKPVAYSGTGVQITNNGTTTIKVKSYSLINLDADKKYQSGWGNTANANSNILSSLLSSGKLGFTTQSVTVNGATKLGVPYTMAYNAAIKTGSSIKNWAVKAKKGSYAVADSSIASQQIKLEIEGGQVRKVIFSEGFKKSDGTKLVPSGTYTIDVGTASTSSILANIEATAGSDVRTAFERLGITGNASTDVLMQAFAHNEGEAVKADANGNTATGLLLNGGSNWYNEYCYCLGIKVEEITFSAKDLIATDKIPLEIGPAQPADKSKYFSKGSTFTITGTTMILGTKTLVSNYTNPQPSFIIADVPVTAA